MRQFYEAGIDTTCFISPIFPGITDVEAIIERAKHHCNLVWLENLNLRGDYRGRILDWIHGHRPELSAAPPSTGSPPAAAPARRCSL